MMDESYRSWGNLLSTSHTVLRPAFQTVLSEFPSSEPLISYGNGRSYGDVCQNNNGLICDMRQLDRIIELDEESGVIECQAGVILNDLLKFMVPRGYFIQVTPGTAYVTLAGMLANDVHGKNHHVKGSFGNHVESFTLLRSDRGILSCSKDENSELFYATIGGLGLTGIILSLRIKLQRIQNNCIDCKTIKTTGLHELLAQFDDVDDKNEYTVSWVDLQSKKIDGLFSSGDHNKVKESCKSPGEPKTIIFDAPEWLLNNMTNKLFNRLYLAKNALGSNSKTGLNTFFYPLDGVANWNRLYGKRGFYQYQFVVPLSAIEQVFHDLVKIMKKFNQPSYLSVLKKFGDIAPLGMMSFPRSGYTLAMDFPNKGRSTLEMFNEFDAVIFATDGAIYPAKDARMNRQAFEKSFPLCKEFTQYRDKMIISDFWRRVSG